MRRAALRQIGLLLLVASAAAAQESATIADSAAEAPPTRLGLRPIWIYWSHLEEGSFLAPRGVFFDRAANEVWVADTRNNLVGVFTPQGAPLFAFGGNGVLSEPAKVVIGPHGRVYVLDNDRAAVKAFSYRGEPIGLLPLQGLGEKASIGTIAMDPDGNLYVGENDSGQVLVYDADLSLKLRFGAYGSDEGQFQSIGGIAARGDRIYVTDHQATAVQVFDRKGNYVTGWGKHEMGAQNFSLPEGIAVDEKGRVFVIDAIRHEIKVFDGEGTLLGVYGGLGSEAGAVQYPSDVAIGPANRVYVVERGNGRVQVFAEEELPANVRKP
jgi:tripartite motif-containing protein 71